MTVEKYMNEKLIKSFDISFKEKCNTYNKSAIICLSVYSREIDIYLNLKTYVQIFIAASFLIA